MGLVDVIVIANMMLGTGYNMLPFEAYNSGFIFGLWTYIIMASL